MSAASLSLPRALSGGCLSADGAIGWRTRGLGAATFTGARAEGVGAHRRAEGEVQGG